MIVDHDPVRQAVGRDWDGVLHVNPGVRPRGLAMLYNPTDQAIETRVRLPLSTTGLKQRVRIREQEGPTKSYRLERDFSVTVPVRLGPLAITWLVVE